MDAAGRRGTPAESEVAIAEMAGVAGKQAEAVCANPKACCEPAALAVAAQDAGRGGSWEGRVNSRATRDDFRPPVGRPLSLHSWMSCVFSSESRSALRRCNCEAIGMPYVGEEGTLRRSLSGFGGQNTLQTLRYAIV